MKCIKEAVGRKENTECWENLVYLRRTLYCIVVGGGIHGEERKKKNMCGSVIVWVCVMQMYIYPFRCNVMV